MSHNRDPRKEHHFHLTGSMIVSKNTSVSVTKYPSFTSQCGVVVRISGWESLRSTSHSVTNDLDPVTLVWWGKRQFLLGYIPLLRYPASWLYQEWTYRRLERSNFVWPPGLWNPLFGASHKVDELGSRTRCKTVVKPDTIISSSPSLG